MPLFPLFVLATSLVCSVLALLPTLAALTAIIWGTLYIYNAFRLKREQLLAAYIINILIIFLLAGAHSLFATICFFGAAVLVMTLVSWEGKDYYTIQKWGIIAGVLGVTFFMAAVFWTSGDIGIEQLNKDLHAHLDETMDVWDNNGLFDLYEQQGISRGELEKAFSDMLTIFAKHLPAFFYFQTILAIFFMLFVAHYVSLRKGLGRLKKRPFSHEIMPWQLVWVVIAGLALWLLGKEEMSYVYYAGSNILAVTIPISVYFGLSAVIYKMEKMEAGPRRCLIAVLIILSLIFILSIIGFLSLIGLFDSLLNYRKLRIEQED